MKHILVFLFIISGFSHFTLAQPDELLSKTQTAYKAFDFDRVIELTDTVSFQEVSDSSKAIELLTMRAVAFYSTGNRDHSRKSFITILSLNHHHELDPSRISPKIISFYRSVKNEYIEMREDIEHDTQRNDEQESPKDTVSVIPHKTFSFDNAQYTGSIARSIFLPGYGHLHSGMTTKGLSISLIAAATLSGYIYYTIETNKREEDYLKQIHPDNISESYKSYDEAYQTRNYCLSAFAVIWLYAQVDLLFFSDDVFIQPDFTNEFTQAKDYMGVHFSWRF